MSVYALILNASFEPLHIVDWQRAMQLLFQGKAEVVEESEHEVHSVQLTWRIPAVLRLIRYVPISHRHQMIRFSRENVFLRDLHQCQYCGKRPQKNLLTLDHVVPVVQGGAKSWENIVTSCKTCNQLKGGRTPREAGLKLLKPARKPQWLPKNNLLFEHHTVSKQWEMYFDAFVPGEGSIGPYPKP